MAELYLVTAAPMPTTAATGVIATGTAIKTLMQVKGGTQTKLKIVEWGISFDASAAATPVKCELLETGTVFATVTAFVAADIHKFGDPNAVDPTTSALVVGTAASGYNASAEGTITATRLFDVQLVAPTSQYVKQFPLGREPVLNVSTSLRIRVTAGTTVNAYPYMVLEG